MSWIQLCLFISIGICGIRAKFISTEAETARFLKDSERRLHDEDKRLTKALWDYESNITDETLKASLIAQMRYDTLFKRIGKRAQRFDLSKVENPDHARKLKILANIGPAILRPDILRKFNQLKAEMGKIYSTAKVELRDAGEPVELSPRIKSIMEKSRDPKELEYYWNQWREQSGKPLREPYIEYVKISNLAAEMNDFKDAAEMKLVEYDTENFEQEIYAMWASLKPLYQELHTYVRTKLSQQYGVKVVNTTGPIPAHVLGDMWGESWENLGDILRPFPNKPTLNITNEMIRQNWTPRKIFEKADEFFQSMGLQPMPKSFWDSSILERPGDGREMNCEASAWDFLDGEDFRIKQCTEINQEDFIAANHEMGQIQYFLHYKNLPHLYRGGANPGFHEAVSDVVSLSVETATYFQRLGLLSDHVNVEDEETNINILFETALKKIAFLPYAYLVDRFRWDVFSGRADLRNMNCHWWRLRHEIQGVSPPEKRSYVDFDPGSKFHVANDEEFIKYFTALIYEFQFLKSLCQDSGNYVPGDPKKPLHRCNLYGSMEAGDKLKEMMTLGASKPWRDAMKTITGERELDTTAFKEYFQPLENWLKKENKRAGAKVEWGPFDMKKVCTLAPASGGNGLNSTWILIVAFLSAYVGRP